MRFRVSLAASACSLPLSTSIRTLTTVISLPRLGLSLYLYPYPYTRHFVPSDLPGCILSESHHPVVHTLTLCIYTSLYLSLYLPPTLPISLISLLFYPSLFHRLFRALLVTRTHVYVVCIRTHVAGTPS